MANNDDYYDKQIKLNGNYTMFLHYLFGCFFKTTLF